MTRREQLPAPARQERRRHRSSIPSTTRSPSPRTTRRPSHRPSPPSRPAEHASRPDDPEADDDTPFVLAVRCARGHVNPIHVSVCQTCGDLLEVGAPTETIRQPPLAMLELPTAKRSPSTAPSCSDAGPTSKRRRPGSPGSVGGRVRRAVALAHPRPHRRRGLVAHRHRLRLAQRHGDRDPPGEEPRILEPWVTHELPIGARLFLGGPTSVVVRAIPTRRGGRG